MLTIYFAVMSDSDDASNASDDSFHGSEVCRSLFFTVVVFIKYPPTIPERSLESADLR